ncbi:MAG TPA: hypothetical protein VNG51_02305 [Ktedonobacteraceae bacterium]|nr:hypothetical protein [Ktedonobacteraceae bacterium]
MTRRIAHRPRFRNVPPQSSRVSHARKDLFRTRWAYRRFKISYAQPTLGQGLLLAPVYRFVHSNFLR